MKKTLSLLLALLLTITLAACGGKGNTENADNQGKSNTENEDNQDKSNTENKDNQGKNDHKEDTQLRPGTVEGSTYTSQFLGIRFVAEGDWVIADDEQMAELSGIVRDSFTDEKIQEQLEKGGTVMDLYAVNQADGSNLNIQLQKLSVLNGGLMSVDAFADASMKELPSTLASAGITVEKVEKTKVSFAGEEHVALVLEGVVQGIPLYETMVLIKSGSYVGFVTATTFHENRTSELLAMCTAL